MLSHGKMVVAIVDGVANMQMQHGVQRLPIEEAVQEASQAKSVYVVCDRTGYAFLPTVLQDVSKDVYWFDLKAFGGLQHDLLCHAVLFPSHRYTQPSVMVRLKDDFREFLHSVLACRVTEEQLSSVIAGEYSEAEQFHAFVNSISDDIGVKTVSGKKCLIELLLKFGHPNWIAMQNGSDSDIVMRRLKLHVEASAITSSDGGEYAIDYPRQYAVGLYHELVGHREKLCKKDVNAMRRLALRIFRLYRRKFCE